MTTALIVVGGYLAGSVPFGYLVVRAFARTDIRSVGSGNIGATNVWRTFGARLGVPVALLDVAKGFGPAFAGVVLADDLAGVLAGGAAMAGHWRPLFLGFAKGGKMVATGGGVFLAVAPLVGLAGAGVWLVVFLVGRYASVASIASGFAVPALAAAMGEPWPVVVFAAVAGAAVIVLHRANIRRLRAGTENRFRFRKRAAAGA